MKKICLARSHCIFLSCLFIFSGSLSIAATSKVAAKPQNQALFPVQSVSLTYDLKKATLHVKAVHPSNNWERDYVRMMTVTLNGQLFSTTNYYHQTSAEGFLEDVELKAQAGDVITVAVYSTQGNSISQDLTVTKPDEAASDQAADASQNASADNSVTNN